MFSVTYTGMNFFPLCTAIVCPTISGTTVDRRDQVRSTFFSLREFRPSTLARRYPSTNAPFFVERAISPRRDAACSVSIFSPSAASGRRRSQLRLYETLTYSYLLRRLTMNLSVRLLLRVLYPRVGWPQGVT